MNDLNPEKDEHFEIELYEPEGGAKVGQINRTAVTIINDDSKLTATCFLQLNYK